MSAIIAKAMNSTIGTDDFKSFDELLLSHKMLLADSETIFCPLNIMVEDMGPSLNETTVLAFKLPTYGSVNLVYSIGLSGQPSLSGPDYIVYIKIYKNGIQIGSAYSRNRFSSEERSSFEITANADDVITITLSSAHTTKYNLYMHLYRLNARIIDCAPVNIISEYGG